MCSPLPCTAVAATAALSSKLDVGGMMTISICSSYFNRATRDLKDDVACCGCGQFFPLHPAGAEKLASNGHQVSTSNATFVEPDLRARPNHDLATKSKSL
jgi:hypothetical protein